jgi:hypothetical protein
MSCFGHRLTSTFLQRFWSGPVEHDTYTDSLIEAGKVGEFEPLVSFCTDQSSSSDPLPACQSNPTVQTPHYHRTRTRTTSPRQSAPHIPLLPAATPPVRGIADPAHVRRRSRRRPGRSLLVARRLPGRVRRPTSPPRAGRPDPPPGPCASEAAAAVVAGRAGPGRRGSSRLAPPSSAFPACVPEGGQTAALRRCRGWSMDARAAQHGSASIGFSLMRRDASSLTAVADSASPGRHRHDDSPARRRPGQSTACRSRLSRGASPPESSPKSSHPRTTGRGVGGWARRAGSALRIQASRIPSLRHH